MSAEPLLRLENVSRRLAGRAVVENIDLRLDRGAVLGLLGVNGAGKTTTLRMVCGVLAPSSGHVFVAGSDLRENQRSAAKEIGYLPEQPPLYPELRVDEYLTFCARLRQFSGTTLRAAVDSVIGRCGLGEVRHRLLGNLSKGFQQRAGIAQAIVHNPALIVLDEPASGLDPLQSTNIRALICELGKDHAVILSTHLIADVNQCCDRVAILHRGRLRYEGPVQAMSNDRAFEIRIAKTPPQEAWSSVGGVETVQFADGIWRVKLKSDVRADMVSDAIVRQGWGLLEFRPEQTNLENVFLRIASAEETPVAA